MQIEINIKKNKDEVGAIRTIDLNIVIINATDRDRLVEELEKAVQDIKRMQTSWQILNHGQK